MNQRNALDDAVKLGKNGLLLISTANEQAIPHIAAAGALARTGEQQIAVTDWFCPSTTENAVPGKAVSVVAWDPVQDRGHQIIGSIAAVEDIAMLDGYDPKTAESPPLPQVERRLRIDVKQVLAFKKAPHSDIVE